MKKPITTESKKESQEMQRRDFLKIPGLTVGLLFGSMMLPPWVAVALSATSEMPLELEGHVQLGVGRFTLPMPAFIIRKMVRSGVKKAEIKAGRFSPMKRRIHHWVVKKLPEKQAPISAAQIAADLGYDLNTVAGIVDELEAEKTFLYRHNAEAINWAYPVTVESTPHHITFGSGESVYAA